MASFPARSPNHAARDCGERNPTWLRSHRLAAIDEINRTSYVELMRCHAKWIVSFILACGLIIACGWYALEGIDFGIILILLIPAGMASTGLMLLSSGLAAWLIPSFRRYYLTINLSWIIVLMLAFAGYLFSRASFPKELEEVKAYVAKADPALEKYYIQHGRYPDSLEQLNLANRPPEGLRYFRVIDSSGTWRSASTRHGNEVYRIDFSNAEYEGNGYWFVDD